MSVLTRVLSAFGMQKHTEGVYREGPYYLPNSGGWLSADAGRHTNWWQNGYSLEQVGSSAMVEACVSAYAQTIAMCPGNHWSWTETKGRERIVTSALTRLLRFPNEYQSISDFLLNATRSLLLEGNAYALAQRNDRFEIIALHLMHSDSSGAQVAENGEIFYHLAGNAVVDAMLGQKKIVVPSRDVLHLRLHTPRHPLLGESPIAAASMQLAAGSAALQQQIQFYLNQARPSFVLSTDQVLKIEQARELRGLWNEQAAGMAQGGTPILTAGLKATAISVSQVDSQLADILKLSDQAIANVFRVPLQKLGIGSTTYSSTEALNSDWLASGLGFMLNHIEEAMGLMFKLKGQPDEYLEFDTSALLRSSFKERIEAYAAATKGGVFSRNEARREFELKPVGGGDEPWVQQQDIPLSVAYDNAKNPPQPIAPALPAPPSPPEPDPVAEDVKELRELVTVAFESLAEHLRSLPVAPTQEEIGEWVEVAVQKGLPVSPDPPEPETDPLAEDVKELRQVVSTALEGMAEHLLALPAPPTQEEITEWVEVAVQKSLPIPIELPAEDKKDPTTTEAFAAMEMLKELAEHPVNIELPIFVERSSPVREKTTQPQVNVTAEIHMPRKGVEKTVVTKHDQDGRIVEFERREEEE